MDKFIKFFKRLGIGLFVLQLWIPVVYSGIFITLWISMGWGNAWGFFLLGLVICLFASLGLSYYFRSKRDKRGESRKKLASKQEYDDEPGENNGRVKGRRKLLIPEKEDDYIPEPQYAVKHSDVQSYGYYDREPAAQPKTDYSGTLHGYRQEYASHLLYDDKRSGQYRPAQTENRGGLQPEDERRSQARQSLYGDDSRGRQYDGQGYTQQEASTRLYADTRQNAEAERATFKQYSGAPIKQRNDYSEPSDILYPGIPDRAAPVRPDRGNASDILYAPEPPVAEPAEHTERRNAHDLLYSPEPERQTPRRDMSDPSSYIYGQRKADSVGTPEFRGFSSYVQPVNALGQQPGNKVPPSLYRSDDALSSERYSAGQAATLQSSDDEFLSSTPATPLSAPRPGSRRGEKPINIFATRADPNTYVYEYSDRYEFIQLLEDNNKRLLKTEFKSGK